MRALSASVSTSRKWELKVSVVLSTLHVECKSNDKMWMKEAKILKFHTHYYP